MLGSLMLIGGSLGDVFGERRLFVMGVPSQRRPDWLGTGLCATGLAGVTFGLVRQPELGWTSPLVARPNFSWVNAETLLVYGGLGLLSLFAKRFGALADRHGPRQCMAAGPLVSAAGVVYVLATVDATPSFRRDVLSGTTIFALGRAIDVGPLTAAVLADADEGTAGIESCVNNAVARVAGLLAVGGAVGMWRIRDPRHAHPAARDPQLVGSD